MGSQLKTITLLGALTALAVGAMAYLAPAWALAAAGVGVVFNFATYFFSDRVVLRIQRARPLPLEMHPRLHAMNAELAAAACIPAPRLYVIEADYANAFATGRGPGHAAIAMSRGLLERLTPREIQGVLAHEMAHVANRDVLIATIAAMLAAIVGAVANALQFSAFFGGQQSDDEEASSPAGSLLFAFVAPVAVTLVQLAISRSREFVADAFAARLTGDPEALASALHRLAAGEAGGAALPAPATASLFIVNPLAHVSSGLQRWFSTHPPVQERIARLQLLSRAERRIA